MSSERKTLKVSFFMAGLRACANWWPSASSVTVSTPREQVQCVLWLAELQSLTGVQRHFRTQYERQPLTRKRILFWDSKLRTASSVLSLKSPGKLRASEENVNRKREIFQRSPRKSIHVASLHLHTNSTFNSAWYATRKATTKIVKDSNDSCTKSEWPSSQHKLPCGHARMNWLLTRFPTPRVLLGRGDVPYQ
jgi:hypothetical protein